MKLTVNGEAREFEAAPDMPLLWALRDLMDVKGPKYGCGVAACGACTVELDGRTVKSCLVLAVRADGASVTTIEGVSSGRDLSREQQAFVGSHALQCGYCTPGMVMAAVSLLDEVPNPTEAEVREGLEGNLCRCTGYHNIVKAVLSAAEAGS